MNKRIQFFIGAVVALAILGAAATSCKNNPRQQAPAEPESAPAAVEESVALTFADVAGMYDSFNESGGNESRVVLFKDGSATWNMIGSLNFTEYTYAISGNGIYFDCEEADLAAATPDYVYDPVEKTLTEASGTIYYLQPGE